MSEPVGQVLRDITPHPPQWPVRVSASAEAEQVMDGRGVPTQSPLSLKPDHRALTTI